jgi:cytidylate kinase
MSDSTQQQPQRTVIAIDGLSASGKSTAARNVARALGYVHVDSGALYRAVCWKVLAAGVDPRDAAAARSLLPQLNLSVNVIEGKLRIHVNGTEPEDAALRTPEVTAAVSAIAAIPEVRALVNARLRALAEQTDVVVEGRDIGTAVFPQTPHKFYMVASAEQRAARRCEDLNALFGNSGAASSPREEAKTEVERLKAELAERDRKDSSRAHDPLRMAADAVVVDTTPNTPEQTAAIILGHIRNRSPLRGGTTSRPQ